jgi:DNA-binding NarL/FixJ family response regulator
MFVPSPRTKVMLVDDHPIVLESLRHLLEPHFTILGAVQDSSEIMTRALEYRPDVILLDACMPGLGGFAATKQLKKLLPTVKVILVTMLTEAISVSEAFQAGANGYVLKQSASDELHAAIDSVLANKRFVSRKIDPEVREAIEHKWLRPEGYSSDLTGRQREVLVLLAEGRTTSYIAQQLLISMKTVEFHKAKIMRKLGVHTTADLIKFALDQGITTLELRDGVSGGVKHLTSSNTS